MTELLRRAISEIEKLPDAAQDAIAARLLAEVADEQAWMAHFDATTDPQWDRLTEAARRDIAAGDTLPLDEVFPPRTPEP